MSKEWREKTNSEMEKVTNEDMRIHSQRPGKRNEDGTIQYFTEQAHKNECDVNKIVRKYDKNGIITHITRYEAQFGDLTGIDFKTAQDRIASAKSEFEKLPSEIRNRFKNQPHELLSFMDDPGNRQEAIKLGLIRNDWTEATDGIGEHIKDPEKERKIKDPEPIED